MEPEHVCTEACAAPTPAERILFARIGVDPPLAPEEQAALEAAKPCPLVQAAIDDETCQVGHGGVTGLAGAMRMLLANMFAVEAARIEVRVTVTPLDDGTAKTKVSVDLDGKTPPLDWCERIEAMVAGAVDVTNAVRPGAVRSMTTGTTEDGAHWRTVKP